MYISLLTSNKGTRIYKEIRTYFVSLRPLSSAHGKPFHDFPALDTSIENGDVRETCGAKSHRGEIAFAAIFARYDDFSRQGDLFHDVCLELAGVRVKIPEWNIDGVWYGDLLEFDLGTNINMNPPAPFAGLRFSRGYQSHGGVKLSA